MTKTRKFLAVLALFSLPSVGYPAGWCELSPGQYSVITHGAMGNRVWLYGNFAGLSTTVWIPIADTTYGSANVSIALAAELAGRSVQVYLDGANDTCATYVSWSGVIRHVRIKP